MNLYIGFETYNLLPCILARIIRGSYKHSGKILKDNFMIIWINGNFFMYGNYDTY